MRLSTHGTQSRGSRAGSPNLFDIFWGSFANGCRRLAQWRKQGVLGEALQAYRRRSIRFETLEPRLLLSADINYVAASGAALDAALRIADVDGTQVLQLVDNGSDTVLGEKALDEDINVTVSGNDLNDTLIIDFNSAATPHQINVNFDGGAGDDTLRGPAENTIWTITGANAGSAGAVSFSGVENLEGAGDNEDTFVVEAGGSVSGSIEGGAGGFDTVVIGDGPFAGVVHTVTGPQSGTVERDGDVLTYSGMEPIPIAAGGSQTVAGDGTDNDITVFDSGGVNDNVFSVQVDAGEDTQYTNASAITDLTISGQGGDDTITLSGVDAQFTGDLIVQGGADDDTYVFNDGFGELTIDEQLSGGVDTLDFSAYTGTISFAFPGGGVVEINGSDGSKVILSATAAANIENIVGANVDLTGSIASVKTELVGGLSKITGLARELAESADFATSLPLIGKNASVTIGKALDFAEALDEIRFQVEEYFDGLGTLTTQDLTDFLNDKFKTTEPGYVGPLDHLGAAILAGKPLVNTDLSAADVYDFKLTVDGVEYHVIVDVDATPSSSPVGNTITTGLGAGPYTVDDFVVAVNAAISTLGGISGQIAVQANDGRLAFQVFSTEIDEFSLAAGALDTAAATKLGIPASPTEAAGFVLSDVQEILNNLGSLNVSIPSAGVSLAVSFEGGVPKLRFGLDYSAERTSQFIYDLGPDAESLGLAFDLEAQIEATAELVAQLQLGLSLQSASTVVFFLDVDALRAGVSTTGSAAAGVDLNLGFLGLSTAGGSTLSLSAGAALDAATVASLQNVTDPSLIDPSGFGFVLTGADGTGSPAFSLNLTLTADTGIGFSASGSLTASGDPFDGASIDLLTDTNFESNFPDFNNLSSQGVISLLGQVAGWLDGLRDSDLISSIDIPLVEGGLDAVLDLAEVLSDALLYDEGADDTKDGADKLVTDLNAALASARLDSLIRAQGDGTKIKLVAVDPNVTDFSIAALGDDAGGFADLGFSNIAASNNADGDTSAIIGSAAALNGRLSGLAAFSVSVTRSSGPSPITREVRLAADPSNSGIGDDVVKLVDANNAPTFANAQELADRLTDILASFLPGSVHYDSTLNVLTYNVSFTDVELFSVELPVDFELDLSPLGEIQSNTRLIIDATGGINFTLGFDLSQNPPASSGALTDSTTLESLDATVKLEEAAAADSAPSSTVGQLSGDASFGVSLGTIEGTSSGGSSTITHLHDPSATFQTGPVTDRVSVGDFVLNRTESKLVRVLEVVSDQELVTEVVTSWLNDNYLVLPTVLVPQLAGQDETDINVTHHIDDQSETSIAVNPVNPDNIVIAVNDTDPADGLFGSVSSSDFVYVTIDGGAHWTRTAIPVPAAAPTDANGARSHGDPAIVFSRDGSRLVFTHMVDKDPAGHDADNANHRHVMVTAVSLPDINGNLGTVWNQADTGVVGYDVAHQAVGFQVDEDGGLNPNDTFPDDSDKEYIAVGPDVDDPSQDRFVVTWHRSNVIYASTSLDGINWTTPKIMGGLTGGDGENAPFGSSIDAIPSFGPNGEIYVVWEDFATPGVSRIMFDSSLDGGLTWGGGSDAKVMFGVDDSTLDSGDEAILDGVIAALNANPNLIITVAGYASTSGTEEHNQDLSDDRAEAVRHYLVDLNGIDASRVTVLGFGETQLAVSTVDGVENADNRRVEITFDELIYTGNVNGFNNFAERSLITGATQGNPVQITTGVPHGLTTGASVLIEDVVGMTELNDRTFTVTVTGASTFTLDGENGTTGHTAYISGGTWVAVGSISGATQASPVVITTPAPHGLQTGDTIRIRNVAGMTELNGGHFVVTVIDNTSFSLENEDGTGHTAYTGGGTFRVVDSYSVPAQPDRGIWMGLSMDVDRSGGTHDGRIYLAFADQGDLDGDNDYFSADHNDTDIFVIASDDFGATWSALTASPEAVGADQVRVNDDATLASQFFSWLSVDQSTGNVAVSWYDARNDDGLLGDGDLDGIANDDVQYFASISFDGGETWNDNIQVSDGTSTAKGTRRGDYGDYTNVVFLNNTVHMAWADTSDSTTIEAANPDGPADFPDTYYDRIRLTNSTIDELINDINDAIDADSRLAGRIQAQADGNRVRIAVLDSSVNSLVAVTSTVDPAFRDLGIQPLTELERAHPGDPLFFTGAKDAPTLVGRLSADASFSIDLGSGAQLVTVSQANTATNRNILDLMFDVQKAINDVLGTDVIKVDSDHGRLLFTRLGTPVTGNGDQLTLTPGTNADELGIHGLLTSDEADLVITESDGVTQHRIRLDEVSTIGQLIAAISAQSGGAIEALVSTDDLTTPVNEAGTSLTIREASSTDRGVFSTTDSAGTATTLNDSTKDFLTEALVRVGDKIFNLNDGSSAEVVTIADGSLTTTPLSGGTDNTWQSGDKYSLGRFKVDMANRSLAAVRLGIIGTDTNPRDDNDVPDGTVIGASIAGAKLLDRFFITAPGSTPTEVNDNLNEVLSAQLQVSVGAVLSDIAIVTRVGTITTITAEGFDFTNLDSDKLAAGDYSVEIKDVAGFAPGIYTVTDVVNASSIKLDSASPIAANNRLGGAGILRTGLDASATFGFIEIGLEGTAEFGAELSWGFNTAIGAPAADGRLTAQEVIDGIGDPLSLMLLPDLTPIPEEGSATAAGTSTTLTDASALFEAGKRVAVGDVIRNITDGSTATIVSIGSDTALTTTALSGGSDNLWQMNDEYEIQIRNFGVVDADVSLDLAGGLSGLASAVGLENPELALRVLALGDPFIGTRFEQANYAKVNDTQFDVDGDFRAKLLPGVGASGTSSGGASSATVLDDASATFQADGVKAGDYIRNDAEDVLVRVTEVVSETQLVTEAVTNWSGDGYTFLDPVTLRFDSDDALVIDAQFSAGKTRVTIVPAEANPSFDVPEADDLDSVILLPEVEVDMSDIGDILPDFQNFGLAEIIALLQALADYLGQFESFGFLNEPIPLIDTSVNDLLGFADDFAQALQEFQANPAGSLQLLEDKLLESLGINNNTLSDIVDFINDGPATPGLSLPSQVVNLDFDLPSGMLKFDIAWGTSFSEGLDVVLPGLNFGDALESFGLGDVLDLAGSANLEAEGTVLARLTLGVSVEDFDLDLIGEGFTLDQLLGHLFLFDTTGLEARLRVAGEDIAFRVGVGPFSLSIGSTDPDGPNPQIAEIELDGSFGLGLAQDLFDPDGDDPDGDEHRVSFSQVVDNLSFDIVETDITGSIGGYLPVFFPNDTRFIGAIRIGGTDSTDTDPTSGEAYSFTPTGDLVNLIETLIDTGELNFELISEDADSDTMGVQGTLENAIAIDVTDVIEGITSFDLTKLSIFDNILLAVDGLDMVLEMVEDIFDGTDITLPLIGDDLKEAAGFIGDMRDDFIDPLRDLVETAKDAAADFSDPNKNVISKAIFDVLGPNGANILRPQEDTTGFDSDDPGYYIGLNTNLDDFLFPEEGETPPDRDEVFMEWDLNLGSELVNEPFDIGFDLGIPGLGLETEGDLNIVIDWALDLSFGLDFVDGFYVKTDDADELLFNAEVTLPGAGITGTLGFLALEGKDRLGGLDFGEFGTKSTALGATFKVDISNVEEEGFVQSGSTLTTLKVDQAFDPEEIVGKLVKIIGGDGDDQTREITEVVGTTLTVDTAWGTGRTPTSGSGVKYQILDPNMGFTEFGNIDFDPRIAAEASAALDLTLGLSDDLVGADVAAGFPSVHGEFRFLWQLGNRGAGDSAQEVADNPATRFRSFESLGEEGFGAIENGLKLVSIENITLDLGSFIGDVLGPIVEEVGKFTAPMQPIIDFITSPVPIIGQLGLDITWLDLAEMLAGDKVNVALIRSITEIISFINQIAELSEQDSVMLPIGDFIIFDSTGDGSGFQPDLWDGGFDLNSAVDLDDPIAGVFGDIFGEGGDLGEIAEGLFHEVLGGLAGESESAQVLQGLTSGQSAGGFSFPFLEDPGQIFGLLMGNNIDLVAYDLGALNFGFEFSQFFSIFGPLGVSIGLDVQIDIDTAFVYDTQGIRDFVDSGFRNPLLLFNGFAIAADPRLDGVDDPELRFFAELQAAAELNLGIARAGVAAAFGFEILFNLFDPDGDGRIRIVEMLGNIENQLRAPSDAEKLLAPLAIFDISGEIFARLFAFLEIDFGFFTFEKEFPIFGPETLLSFEVDFFRPPILASELDNGDLLIHTGEFADQRLLGEATDISEHIKITKVGESSGTITVTIESTGSSTGGDSLGDDSEVPLEYKMKKGSKIVFDGGKGNDRIEVAGFNVGDVLFEIDMGVGDDEVLLSGGIADKFSTIIGGKGKDDITGSAGADLITGGQGDDTINAGDGEDLVFGDEGEVGTDLATGTARPTDGVDTINGEGGSDILFGGGGRDSIDGGSSGHSDLLIGGEGTVFFQAGTFKKFANVIDLLQDGVEGVENLALDKSAGDVLTGDAGDIIYGTAGPDVITGTDENDIIFGMGGADIIDGLGGNDIIFGDGGQLNLGAGGEGTATGGDANTLTDTGANFSSVKVGDYVLNLSEDKFVRVTAVNSSTSVETEAVTSWSGDSYKFFVPTPVAGTADSGDRIEGGTGDDLIFGGGGNDFLAGDVIFDGADPLGGDDDQIFGGSGADRIFGDNVEVDGLGNTATVPEVSGDGDDRLFGQGENDVMYGGGGFDYMDGGAGSDRLFGGDDSDTLIFNKGADRLDGEGGGDGYFAIMQGGNTESLVIAQDTGGATGSDILVVQGTVLDDQFLLRANDAGTDAFVAMIKNEAFVERVNYGGDLERILINGSFGDDHFAIDDTAAEITVNGDFGDDTFQVGQIFRSQRIAAEANIKVQPFDDQFATIETTRGFLSNGISEQMTINGGLGRDLFTVFHNKAVLQLNGEGGDDTFEIRAFALVGSQEPQRERTDLSGGEGADLVMYVVNAPVNIDGGDGFDTVVVIGTEFGDDFVVTEDGVFGAGLTVSFVNIESLRVDAAEGNDRIFVQSTSEKFITEIFGGLGEDTVFMSGDTPPIVSNDLRGHSGIVLHGVESNDASFDGQNIFGISANVADNDEPFVVLRPTDGSTIITEGGLSDEFSVVLTRAPTRDIDVLIFAPLPTPSARERGAQMFRVFSSSAIPLSPDEEPTVGGSSITLRFTTTNWFLPQTVQVIADGDLDVLSGAADAGGSATVLIDAGVDFIASGILVGDTVTNVTDGSISTVVSIDNANQITTTALAEGSLNTWGDGDSYRISRDVFQDRSPAFLPLATRPEIVGELGVTGEPPRDFIYDDEAFEGVRFGVVSISVKATVVFDEGLVVSLNTARTVLTVNAADLGDFDATTIIGQNLQIKAGPGMGQNRFVTGYNDIGGGQVELTLDREYSESEFPDNTSTWRIQDDDSLVGVMDSFDEDTAQLIANGVIPDSSDPDDERSIFVDAEGSFLTGSQGEGLVGAVLEIVAGTGRGQQQLILGHGLIDPETTLILSGNWRTNPDDTSVYRIERYDGLALPSVSVQVNDNDQPGLVVDETRGFEDDGDEVADAADVVADFDTVTAVIEGGDGDHLGEREVIRVHLSTDPAGTVEVGLIYDATQLEITTLDGTVITNEAGHRLSFTDLTSEDLVVTALVDGLREGFHTSLIGFELHSGLVDDDVEVTEHFQTFTDFPVFFLGLGNAADLSEDITVEDDGIELVRVFTPDSNGLFVGGDYYVVDNKIVFVDATGDPLEREGLINVTYTFNQEDFDGAFTQPVLARINDFEAPTVIVRETGGSTDVIELQGPLGEPESIPFFDFLFIQIFNAAPWIDSYQLLLSAAPTDDVTVTVTPDITKTTRTGGIRHDDVQVEVFSSDARAERQDFTADATGGSTTTLLDADATFISDGVQIGTLIRTLSGNWVHVIDVVSENELTTEAAGVSWDGQDYTFGNWTVTFTDADWDDAVQFFVRAIDDDQVDGQDTQVFKPGPATLSGILGPVVLEGAGGSGSLSLGVPVMLPGETNLRAPSGTVAGFTAGTGFGATEFMTVYLEDLEAFLDADDAEGDDLQTLDDLIGLTIEMARGQGLGVQLNPDRPQEAYDRFWRIEGIEVDPLNSALRILDLKNPSQIDPSTLPVGTTPIADPSGESFVDLFADGDEPTQAYAITALSANFFVEETVQIDFVFVNDQDSLADSSGVLTSTRLYGFNMGPDLVIGGQLRPGGITYDDFEVIEINLGKGNNNLEVLGTQTREDGYRSWTLINTGDETVAFADVDDPLELEKGDDVVLHLNAEDEVFTGTVDEAQNADVGAGILTTTITVDQSFDDGSLQGALISIGQLAGENTDATGQVRRILNNVGNVLTVDRPWAALPTDEIYTVTNEADGPIAVNLQLGDDSLDGSDSDLGIVAFGGLGQDTLIGGDGDDILFGDRGRVDYFNEIGAIVTRLGDAPEPITGFVTAQVVEGTPGTGETDLFTIEDTGTKLSGGVPIGGSFPVADTDGNEETGTEDIGLRGLYVDINNGFGFLQPVKLISGNDATHLFLSTLETDAGFDPDLDLPGPVAENPSEYRISTIPEDQTDGVVRDPTLLLTIDNNLGDVDTITAGGGNDTVFGGAGGDTIDAGDDDDTVIGDAGRVDRERDPEASDDLVVFPPRAEEAPVVPTFVVRVRTIEFGVGGEDDISGGAGADLIFGGADADTIHGNDGTDTILGDNAEANYLVGVLTDVKTTDSTAGTTGDDEIHGDGGTDLAIGGFGSDTISGGADADILIGDAAEVLYDSDGVTIVSVETVQRSHAGNGDDTMYGDGGDDIVSGGSGSDNLDGGANDDLIFGDNVLLLLVPDSGSAINPRFRQLGGPVIYDDNGDVEVADPEQRPGGNPVWGDWDFTLDQTETTEHFGDDYIAGGAHDDQIFGQRGDDTIQGDGSISGKVDDGNPVAAARDGSLTGADGLIEVGTLQIVPSFEDFDNDGDDYIEGNAGTDLIFGNLGQDDIIGGSSTLFSLEDRDLRDDGFDLVFGGAGTDVLRNNPGDGSHGRDADAIAGDNANIYRLVGAGAYLDFNYDDDYGIQLVPRAIELIGTDYTPGGPDRHPASNDIGAGDELHGESGDDQIYGMTGNDVLFGEGEDDVLIAGWGDDWISGGSGDDGILGDDGRLMVSRNSTTEGEPLYGVEPIPADQIDRVISAMNEIQFAIVNVDGLLKYTADLTPDNLDPTGLNNTFHRPVLADDIIYGGLGTDSIHGGSGDDAVSGAEALEIAYTNNYDTNGTKLNGAAIETGYFNPFNPGNVLGYQTGGDNATKFALYVPSGSNAEITLRKTLLDQATGALVASGGVEWLLNFSSNEGPDDAHWIAGQDVYVGVQTDGDDHIFGDLGNDWLVGGTGRDSMWAGRGDDLMNADDVLSTTPTTDTNPSYEDLMYGGAGRDVMLINTNGDRAIDWVGEFNSYYTPFSAFGFASVLRLIRPAVPEYLLDLSKSQGSDQTLFAVYGSDSARNGEPFGELGMVLQQDAEYGDQNGPPRDPQPGHMKGKLDVNRSAGVQPLYQTAAGSGPGTADYLTDAQLASQVDAAKQYWVDELGAGDGYLDALSGMRIEVGNLLGDRLGATFGNWILIDSDAAGHGWRTDVSGAESAAFEGMDLLSVVTHEIGHALGFGHDDADAHPVMHDQLDPGGRFTDLQLAMEPAKWLETWTIPGGLPGFDLGSGPNGVNGYRGIDWQGNAGDGWNVKLSPYAPAKPVKNPSPNFAGFLVKLLGKDRGGAQAAAYDSLGHDLLGANKGQGR